MALYKSIYLLKMHQNALFPYKNLETLFWGRDLCPLPGPPPTGMVLYKSIYLLVPEK